MTRAFSWLVAGMLCCACGSDDDSGGPAVGGSSQCAEGEYALAGSVGGEAVSARGTLNNHAWIQTGSRNTLDTDFEGGGRLHTEWSQLIKDGESTAVTGSITLPPGTARAGVLMNAGSGAQRKLDDEVRFELTQLSESVQCIAPPCPPAAVEGSINGCVHWRHIGL
jgi:hypothetical protein